MSESLVKKIWKTLFCLSFICFISIASQFCIRLYDYLKLSHVAPVEILEWIPVQIKADRYIPEANYSFESGGRIIEGFYRFEKPVFMNQSSCQVALEKLAQRSWQVYYNPKNLESVSLQHLFPVKYLIHTLLAFFVLAYFFWFGDYVLKGTKKRGEGAF